MYSNYFFKVAYEQDEYVLNFLKFISAKQLKRLLN